MILYESKTSLFSYLSMPSCWVYLKLLMWIAWYMNECMFDVWWNKINIFETHFIYNCNLGSFSKANNRTYYNNTIDIWSLICSITRYIQTSTWYVQLYILLMIEEHAAFLEVNWCINFAKWFKRVSEWGAKSPMRKICKVISIAINRFEKMTLYGNKHIFIQITENATPCFNSRIGKLIYSVK